MLSVVIPVYNEAASLERLHGELVQVARAHGYDLEVIFVDDGSLFKPYDVAVDSGDSYLPGLAPDVTAPEGRVVPKGGFEKFWRGRVPGYEWVQPQLGWALADETGYSALWQCNTAELNAKRCYFTGPGDEIIVLAQGSANYWNYWQLPVR